MNSVVEILRVPLYIDYSRDSESVFLHELIKILRVSLNSLYINSSLDSESTS